MTPMTKGPNGQKRPGDVIGAAIMVAKIATGEIADSQAVGASSEMSTLGRKGGLKGGQVRAARLPAERRAEIARAAAAARWSRDRDDDKEK